MNYSKIDDIDYLKHPMLLKYNDVLDNFLSTKCPFIEKNGIQYVDNAVVK